MGLLEDKILIPEKGKGAAIFKKKFSGFLFISPHLIFFTVFFLFPFVFSLVISLFKWDLYDPSNRQFIGFANYRKILFDKEAIAYNYFWQGLWNTIFFVLISVPLLVIIPLIVALLLDMKPWGHRFFSAILFMPTLFSISAVVLMWKGQFNSVSGFINSVLMRMGMRQPIAFFTVQPWAWITIFIVTIWWTMGTNMVILHAGLKNINRSMYEAAQIDGASYIKTVLKIAIPSLSGQMLVVLIMTILGSFNIYGQPYLLTGGGPRLEGMETGSTSVLMMYIRQYAQGSSAQPGVASAMAICMGLIMMAVSLTQTFIMRKRGSV